MKHVNMNMPLVIPCGWKPYAGVGVYKETVSGLLAIYSIDTHSMADLDCPPMGSGKYNHISISQKDKYPEWDEMRDFIYDCGLFDGDRDVVMFLPRKEDYVNVHKNCFHFYQKKV